jgi:hypothetical protein
MHIQAARAARFSAPKTEEEKEAAAKAAARAARFATPAPVPDAPVAAAAPVAEE